MAFVARVYGLSVIPLWFGYDLISGILAGIGVGFGLAGFLVTPAMVSGNIIDEDAERTAQRGDLYGCQRIYYAFQRIDLCPGILW